MKNGHFYSLMLLSMVIGCSTHELTPAEETNKGIELVFTAEYGETQTRTAFQPDGKEIWWGPADEICIYYGASNGDKFVAKNDTETPKAEFHGTISSFTGTHEGSDGIENGAFYDFWAVYPFEAAVRCNGDAVVANLAAVQTAKAGSFAPNTNISVAKSPGLALSFYNTCAWFRFSVVKEGIKTVTFKGNDNEDIAGTFKVAMDANDRPTELEVMEGAKEITLQAPEGETLEVGAWYYITLLPQTFSKGFTITFETETESGTRSIEKETTYKRSMYNTGEDFDKQIEYIMIIDLSAAGTANSYIVSKAGNYKFDCRFQGNSTDATGEPESAVVLWETFNNGTKPNEGDVIASTYYNDGYVYFNTPSELCEGNALIAIKSSTDEILWSWHLWITAADLESLAQEYPNGAGVMMDRNLGALTNEPKNDGRSRGFYYQWGRKDPFWDRFIMNVTSEINTTESVRDSFNSGITYAIQHPTTFIKGNNYNYDWVLGFNPLEDSDITRWGAKKTKYDPCPRGWKVPDGGTDGFWSKAHMENLTLEFSNDGILFPKADTAGNDIYYPAGGYFYYLSGSLYEDKKDCYYWSSTSYKRESGGMAFAQGFSYQKKTLPKYILV